MLIDAGLRDFLIAIGVSGTLAVGYFMTLRTPDRNVFTRAIDRWTEIWSESAWDVPKRAQLWIVFILSSLIALAGLVALVVKLAQGSL